MTRIYVINSLGMVLGYLRRTLNKQGGGYIVGTELLRIINFFTFLNKSKKNICVAYMAPCSHNHVSTPPKTMVPQKYDEFLY